MLEVEFSRGTVDARCTAEGDGGGYGFGGFEGCGYLSVSALYIHGGSERGNTW